MRHQHTPPQPRGASDKERAPAAPRPWLLALGISPGHKELLIYLWTYGPHWRTDDPLPESGEVKAWPTKATCARDLGRPLGTINRWVQGLTRAGWVRRAGNVWELAVLEPWPTDDPKGISSDPPTEAGGSCKSDPGRIASDPMGISSGPDQIRSGGDQIRSGGDQIRSGGGISSDPQILQGSSKDPPKILHEPQAHSPSSEAKSAHDGVALAANPHLVGVVGRHREISAKRHGPLFDPPPRDLVPEVVRYFEQQSAALRQELGMPIQRPAPMTTGVRHEIAMRLFGVEGDDDTKLAVATRVIDVQVAQCRARSEKHESDMGMLSLLWLFSERNFDRVLDRWREDGAHVLWWARPEPSADDARQPCGKCRACKLGYPESCNPYVASAGGEA